MKEMKADDLYRQIGRITVAHGQLHTFVEVLMSHLVGDMKAMEIVLDGAPFSKWLETIMRLVRIRADKSTHEKFRKAISVAKESSAKRNEIVHDYWFVASLNLVERDIITRQPRRLSKRKNTAWELATDKPNMMELIDVEAGLILAKQLLHDAFLDAVETTPALKARAMGKSKTPRNNASDGDQ
jgi:predicted nucleic acid-binding protein